MKRSRVIELVQAMMDTQTKIYQDQNTSREQKALAMERFGSLLAVLPLVEAIDDLSVEPPKAS